MPKKFRGTNTKAEAAKERKAADKQAAEDKKRQEEEDAYWKDDADRRDIKKEQRKADREKRRLEQVERKHASKKLLEEEEMQLQADGMMRGAGATKMTRAQIEETQRRVRESQATASALPKGVTVEQHDIDNPNHLLRQRRMEGEEEARSVDEAIAVLSVSKEPLDMHPEKRIKAAYAVFEERELPRLRDENQHLRMSQVKQLLRKEWHKSPENPLNQSLAKKS